MSRKYGRHAPAFLLLLLANAPSYGALLLSKLESELPYNFSDSAIVYRSLQEIEKNGFVESNWETVESSGPPRKWYTITSKGRQALHDYAEEIRQRQANFDFFLSHYKSLNVNNHEDQ